MVILRHPQSRILSLFTKILTYWRGLTPIPHAQEEKSSLLPVDLSRQNSYSVHMKQISAREAKNQFGQFLDWAQQEPVRVTKRGRAVGVLLSEEQYQRLRGAAWEQLGTTLENMRDEAQAKGLTDEIMNDLLSDES